MKQQPRMLALTRRGILKGGAYTVLAALAARSLTPALAASGKIKVYGTAAQGLEDWSGFTEATDLDMEFTPTNGDPGVVMREIVSNEIGETYDLFLTETGMQKVLGKDWFLPIDTGNPALTLWSRVSEAFTKPLAADGVQYGVPNVGGADSFGYRPEALGVTDPKTVLSWELMFESEKTKGRVGLSTTLVYSFPLMAQYVANKGYAKIADVTNLTGPEAKAVADFGIERKKAGQFRSFFVGFDEQTQLLGNGEVDILNCWSDAVVVANEQAGKTIAYYAYADYYFKWGNALFIAKQAKDRGTLDAVYKTLNFFLGGEYLAQMAIKGLVGPNMDLAVEFAKSAGWAEEDVAKIESASVIATEKFKTEQFTFNPVPSNLAVMEEEWQRFLSA
ncbi:MAG: extracellular solute-binding protein [Bauldia sp.]|uniref:ABC transporter substrate-binding protein n=1 Tax=Bauldia sp. TaxID=2575872 RepID=UPI001D7DEEB6|nr:PotD/PotF family extracellular solute-binding protein [Bauldia sp.]MCB1497513.1 extracellular solute-binding protein [Bauldia sp.]